MEKLKYSLLFMISILAISNRWVSANDIDDERNRITTVQRNFPIESTDHHRSFSSDVLV